MSLVLQLPLAASVAADDLRRRTVGSLASAARLGAAVLPTTRGRAVRNDAAPLVLVAIIAVAAAVALIIAIGLAAAWLYFCQTSFGHNWFPVVGVPGKNASYYYFGCRRLF